MFCSRLPLCSLPAGARTTSVMTTSLATTATRSGRRARSRQERRGNWGVGQARAGRDSTCGLAGVRRNTLDDLCFIHDAQRDASAVARQRRLGTPRRSEVRALWPPTRLPFTAEGGEGARTRDVVDYYRGARNVTKKQKRTEVPQMCEQIRGHRKLGITRIDVCTFDTVLVVSAALVSGRLPRARLLRRAEVRSRFNGTVRLICDIKRKQK